MNGGDGGELTRRMTLARLIRAWSLALQGAIRSAGPDGLERDDYDHVVNALWDGRLAVDATLGIRPKRPWLYRFRYGVRFESRDVLKIPKDQIAAAHVDETVVGGRVVYTRR